MCAQFTHIETTCPHCDAAVELTAGDIPEGQIVHCSSCKAELGQWRDLKQAAQHDDDQSLASASQASHAA